MSKNVKKRNWAFVLYPESAPEDWKEQLRLSGLQGAISPQHDKDINPTGEPKKPHYHVILVYGSPTTYSNVKAFTDKLNQPIPQALEQVRGYYRYFTHKDNPEKYQYDEREIETFNGFNIADFVELTRSEVTTKKHELLTLAREKGFSEYAELVDYVQDNMDMTYFDIVSSHTLFFVGYMRSVRYRGAGKLHDNPTEMATMATENSTETPIKCCPNCGSIDLRKHGKTAALSQRWECRDCGSRFVLDEK